MSALSGKEISYLVIDTHNHVLAQTALRNSQITFPLDNRVVFSDVSEGWEATDFIKIEPINSIKTYCEFLLKHAWKFVKTEFFITIQYDGFVLNSNCFSDEFFKYDFIGAPWPHFDFYKVGNGGFSMRSKRLMSSVEPLIQEIDFMLPEDIVICRKYRQLLERHGAIKYAPPAVAEKFSQELAIQNHSTFGFHGYTLLPFVYRNNLGFLFENLPPSKNSNKFRELKIGCEALGVKEADLAAFSYWCNASRSSQGEPYLKNHG